MPTPSGKGKRLLRKEAPWLDGCITLHELQEHNDKLLSVVSALESYMKDKGETTCWIEVCVQLEGYRKWRRENA